jgi:hypothetical protein
MQFKQTALRLAFLTLPFTAFSQTTYLPQGAKENILLERLEIKGLVYPTSGESTLPIPYQQMNHPFSRKVITQYAQAVDSTLDTSGRRQALSRVDRYNLYTLYLNNLEWVSGPHDVFLSKKPILKNFYRTPANLFEVNTKDFFLAVNPMIQFLAGKESDNDQNIFLNTRGVSIRGRIADKIGFAGYLTDNQERDPLYVQQFVNERKAVPGMGFYQDFKGTGYDYFDARGYVTFGVTKYIDVQFGYDKNFIGDGQRSLFLSDFGAPALFLKLNTKIWRLNYQNLFMELTSANTFSAGVLYPKKYAAMHHLDMAITKWLNIGLFEGIIFGRKDHFEFGYLNPVIFYRHAEQQNGSFDNSVVGLDAKANVAHSFQFYTQFLLDEFSLKEIRNGSGWWGNKWGLQVGAKYIDAFGVRNLDLQLEANRVRPFTYSHTDSVANYTHYNQPLAHPLGANFQEWIGTARYQPAPKWMIEGKLFYNNQGKDTGAINNGGNIFLPNAFPYRAMEFGYTIPSGLPVKTALGSLHLSYELKPGLFLEAQAVYRKQGSYGTHAETSSVTMTGGIRWNVERRKFEF